MSRAAEFFGSRHVPQFAALVLIAFGVAGCSGDMSTRFSQSSFSNPFNYQPESTASAPAQPVERRELPQYARPQSQYQSSSLPPVVAAPQSYPVRGGGVSGGGRGVASYTPPPRPKLDTTSSVPPRSIAATHAQGGTTIIVGTSDTLEVLAQRYHVTPAAILAANGYKGPRSLSPGQSLLIPQPGAAPVAAAAPVAPAPAVAAAPAAPLLTRPVAVAAAPAPAGVHVVNKGDTL